MNSRFSNDLITYGPAFVSGCLLVLCFPAIDFFAIAWIALVPFLLSLYGKGPKQAFKTGVVLGIPYFFGTLYWIYYSINHYGGMSFIGSIAIVVLLCLYLSLYTGIFGLLFSIAIRRTKLPALLIAPVFWVVLEFLRSYIFTGFPWSSIGYTQYKFLTIIQIADITGIYGVSFLVVAVNGALADIFLIKKRTRDMPLFPLSQTVIGFSVLLLFIVSTFVYGHAKLHQERSGGLFRASIVQGDIEQDKKWEPSYQDEVMRIYEDLSLKAASSSPSLIVWPETAVPFFFIADKERTREMVDFQRRLNSYLLFGSVLIKGKSDDKLVLSNSAVLLNDTGKVTYSYDKIHLVPFGEYVPLRKMFFFINRLVGGMRTETAICGPRLHLEIFPP
jgi:apolipoprotein N-acyltransferase